MKNEIERKFLVRKMPNLLGIRPIHYERYYLYSDGVSSLRVQRKDFAFELERKEKISTLKHKKDKIAISEGEFKELTKKCKKVIIRDSYLFSNNPNITIKKYGGRYSGLIRAEVEFETEGEANAYRPSAWMGKEITDSKLGKDGKLIKLSKREFLTELKKYKSIEE